MSCERFFDDEDCFEMIAELISFELSDVRLLMNIA